MIPVQTVVFDLGKVLVDFDYGIAVQRLAARAAVSADILRRGLMQDGLLERYELGHLSSQAFCDAFRQRFGWTGDFTRFAEEFADIFSVIPPMVAWHGVLRAQGVPLYIFSNTNELAVSHIHRRFPFFRDFDGYVLSYEHGAMKPSEALYREVERVAGRTGSALFYVDDRPENIETAVRLGWRGVMHIDAPTTLAAARAAGLPVA